MPRRRGNVLATLSLDDRPLQSGLQNASRSIDQWSRQANRRIGGLQKGVSGLSSVIGGLGASAHSSLGALHGALGGITTILSGGLLAAVGIGVGALVSGIVKSVRAAREAREHMAALAAETGITSEQVTRLQQAFAAAGQDLDRIEAQKIAQIAAAAGVSTAEVERLSDRIMRLATLEGIDPAAAAQRIIQAHAEAYRDIESIAERLLRQEAARAAGISETQQRLAERSSELMERHTARTRELAALEREAAKAAEQAAAARKRAAEYTHQAARRGAEGVAAGAEERRRRLLDDAEKARAELEAIEKALQQAGEAGLVLFREQQRAAEEARETALREARARAEARKAARMETDILAAVAARDEEGAAIARLTLALAQLEARRRQGMITAADAARQAEILTRQHQDAVDALARHMVTQLADARLQIQAAEAQLTGDLVAQAKVRSEASIEQTRRQYEEQIRLIDATWARIAELEQVAEGDRTAAQAAELERLRRRYDHEVQLAEATAERITLAERQAAAEIKRIEEDRARARADYDAQTAAILAGVHGDRLQEIRLAAARELEEVRRLEEAKTITLIQAEQRRRAIREQMQAELAQATQQQIATSLQSGTQIASAFTQGVKRITESDDFADILRSFLGIASSVAMVIPGGQVAGGVLGFFGGLFRDGGLIRGPGGPRDDRILAAVSAGEYVLRADAVRQFGVGFLEELNRGRLDLRELPRYADGGLVGGGASSPAAPVVTGAAPVNTTINVTALTPKATVDVLARYVEPAQHARSVARSDARVALGLRRRILPPRSSR